MSVLSKLARPGRGFGQGKLILFGEHSVVHGRPAIAATLDRGARAKIEPIDTEQARLLIGGKPLDETGDPELMTRAFEAICAALKVSPEHLLVDVTLDLFPGAGLGSSAAWAVSIARALCEGLELPEDTRETLVEAATQASEQVFHGRPSGVDQSAAMGRGLFSFRRLNRGVAIEDLQAPPFELAICLAGPPSSTAKMVEGVAALGQRFPSIGQALHEAVGDVALAGAAALVEGDLAGAGELMNINHGLLSALGVSTDALDAACHLARAEGALGAKLTGAGGGGCVFALATQDTLDAILATWKAQGWPGFRTRISTPAR